MIWKSLGDNIHSSPDRPLHPPFHSPATPPPFWGFQTPISQCTSPGAPPHLPNLFSASMPPQRTWWELQGAQGPGAMAQGSPQEPGQGGWTQRCLRPLTSPLHGGPHLHDPQSLALSCSTYVALVIDGGTAVLICFSQVLVYSSRTFFLLSALSPSISTLCPVFLFGGNSYFLSINPPLVISL